MQDRELKYAFTHRLPDSSLNVFGSVEEAKAKILFNDFDFSLGTQTWSLAESGTVLVLTWLFTEAQADDQLTVHNAILDGNWTVSCTAEEDSTMGLIERKNSLEHYRAWGQFQS